MNTLLLLPVRSKKTLYCTILHCTVLGCSNLFSLFCVLRLFCFGFFFFYQCDYLIVKWIDFQALVWCADVTVL